METYGKVDVSKWIIKQIILATTKINNVQQSYDCLTDDIITNHCQDTPQAM